MPRVTLRRATLLAVHRVTTDQARKGGAASCTRTRASSWVHRLRVPGVGRVASTTVATTAVTAAPSSPSAPKRSLTAPSACSVSTTRAYHACVAGVDVGAYVGTVPARLPRPVAVSLTVLTLCAVTRRCSSEPRVFATGMAMGGMARGGFNQKLMAPMAMPAMAPMPEMAMDGAAGGGPPQAMLFGAPQIDADVAVMADNAGENGVAGGLDLTAAEAGGALDDAAMEEDEAVEGGPGLAGGMVGDAAMDMNMGDAAPPPMPPRAPIMHDAMMKDDGALPPAGRPMRAKRQHAGRMHRPAYHQRPGFQRQFAFKRRANRKPNDRSDFTNTVFWEAGSATDNTGVATFTFDLSDSVTSFRVEVDGFSSVASLLGSATIEIKAVEPFYARMRLPIELTDGDRVSIPVTTVLSSPPSAG